MLSHIKRLTTKYNIKDEKIADELQKICNLGRTGRVHTESRQRSIKSHIRDVPEMFTSFTYDEFYNYVCVNYINAVLSGKKLSRSYLLGKINTIKRLSKTKFFGKRDVSRIIGNLDKMMNPLAATNEFYTTFGEKIHLDRETIVKLRTANKRRLSMGDSFRQEGDLVVSHLYTDSDCELLGTYFKRHLENFLSSEYRQATVYDELALIITFMIFSPRRVNEIIKLTTAQWEDLITMQITTIQSKSNLRPTKLLIPITLATYLQNYYNMQIKQYNNNNNNSSKQNTQVTDDNDTYSNVIKSSYQQLLKTLKQTTASLLHRRVERPFHGFRNYFAGKFNATDYQNTKRALDHASGKITKMYAFKQKQQYDTVDALEFLNKCTLNNKGI